MLLATVVLPEAFAAANFVDPEYHHNTQSFLLGVHDNGILLFDAENRLRNELYDHALKLASVIKGFKSHLLLAEMLTPGKQKRGCVVRTACSFEPSQPVEDVAVSVATQCKADALLVDPTSRLRLVSRVSTETEVISVPDYGDSTAESKRRRCIASLPPIDKMSPLVFDRHIAQATRFSRWLRFYDKQIGKNVRKNGGGLIRFKRGLERILKIWTTGTSFPRAVLSADVFTVVDVETTEAERSETYYRVESELIEPLQQQFGISIKLHFKWEHDSICHSRHLETESIPILFEKGFDFLKFDGAFCRTFIKPDRECLPHLQEYQLLREYIPGGITKHGQGIIKKLMEQGFGFIMTDGNDLFFHSSKVQSVSFNDLHEGQMVAYTEGQGPRGPCAENVKPV